MPNEPIKLQSNLNLYSGDVIKISNNNTLLVEVENDKNKTIKLRKIKSNKYLSKNFLPIIKSLSFSTDFESVLTFTINQSNNGKISLQTDDNKYLKSDGKNFSLSSKKRLLTITKQQNIKNIANFEETIEIIKLHKEKEEKNNNEEVLINCKSYDNKTNNPLEYNFTFSESIQKEHNFTCSDDFAWGVSAKFSCSPIAGLEMNGQIEKKTSISNSITKIETKTIQESLRVKCTPWKKTRVKLLARKVELLTPYTANVKRTIGEKSYEYLIDGEYSSNNYSESCCLTEEITARNILIVGLTGSGKSTLAKVLSGSDEFVESSQSTSGTKWGKKSNEFEWEGNYYCVIDNIGFGDTKVSERDVLMRIGEAINSAYQGLNHVLFVFDGRFSDKEKESFRKLAALKITNSYITLIKSNFDNFGNKRVCDKDRKLLEQESSEINQLLNNCRGLLHIDNDDKDSRDKSRKKVLDHLHSHCLSSPFKPKEWENISSLIDKYFEEKGKLEKNKNQADVEQKKVIEQQIDNLKTDTADQIKEKMKGEEIREFIEIIEVK